ncbi:hypothetical protein ABEB36_014186 [Hypothenemus hampei]|uniref:Regulatory protein zeste n=1 Tax=Hypothenemus hampei TaxID=57062 RepID=A0ABD1E3U6_HYPHA
MEKKQRSSNFSKEEELLLVEEVLKLKQIIENKKTNNYSNTEKNEAWQKVERAFNAKGARVRCLAQLKSKFDNLKTKARKYAVEHKNNYKGTGGGPSKPFNEDPVLNGVLEIISHRSAFGMEPDGDCDMEDPNSILQNEDFSSDFLDIHQEEAVNLEEILNQKDYLILTPPPSSPTPNIGQKVKKAVRQPIVQKSSTIPTSGKWSSYTGKQLKEPVTKRLRPKIPNVVASAKEAYYQHKTELVKIEIENAKRRDEREERKDKREEELFKKQILLLDKQLQS